MALLARYKGRRWWSWSPQSGNVPAYDRTGIQLELELSRMGDRLMIGSPSNSLFTVSPVRNWWHGLPAALFGYQAQIWSHPTFYALPRAAFAASAPRQWGDATLNRRLWCGPTFGYERQNVVTSVCLEEGILMVEHPL